MNLFQSYHFHLSKCPFVSKCLDYCRFVIYFENRKQCLQLCSFISRIIWLFIHGFLWFHINFRMGFSISIKIPLGFERECLEYVDFNNIKSFSPEHMMPFHLCLIKFLSVFYSFQYTSLSPTQINLFLSIFCDCTVHRMTFLISFLDSLLLMYRNAIDFCMLISYSATLVKSLLLIVFLWSLHSF